MWTLSVRSVLVAGLLWATGCFFEPPRPAAASSDAATDGPRGPTPVARKIAAAYYSNESPPSTATMMQSAYSVPTAGINDGDLVLFIANIDNGSNTAWMLPTASFHQLAQVNFGGDGQTFVAAWTIAHNEPATYAQPYGSGIMSGCSAISLIAVTGADPTNPIEAAPYKIDPVAEDPVAFASDGVTTTAPNSLVVFAGGADWYASDATISVATPSGFDMLDLFSDRGGLTFEWTTLLVATKAVAAAGPTGPSSTTALVTPDRMGAPWAIEIAIAPAPQ